jgi:ribonuclease HI
MSKGKKYYVVLRGRKTGIFETWDDCKEQIHGFEQAQYKSFKTLTDAEQVFQQGFFPKSEAKTLRAQPVSCEKPQKNGICVDAACSVEKQVMEYRGIFLETRKVLFHRGPYDGGTNNIGEFLAIVHAMAYMQKNGIFYPIYTDSKTAITWVEKKKINTKIDPGPKVKILIDKAIHWLYSNEQKYVILKWNTSLWGEIPADFGRK